MCHTCHTGRGRSLLLIPKRYALEIVAPKPLFAAGGNHDAWTTGAAGIEQASRFDKGRGFDVEIGAHTHVGGLSWEFNR
jgi:hypothetical protein